MARNDTGLDKPRFQDTAISNAVQGRVVWSWKKSLWISAMYAGTGVGLAVYLSLETLCLFLVTTAGVLCFGHSLGMHRRLIHNSFTCPLWLEHVMVYLGSLVGLGGPVTMIRTHDIRDWAQRKAACHDYFAHRQLILKDAWWQMHCDIRLDHPPELVLEDRVRRDWVYRFLEQTSVAQQLPWAVLFYFIGGWGWVLFGICARVAVSVTGHWLIGYFAHRRGRRNWHVEGAGVQGYNIPFAGLITFGECWHNNHHAYPGSARIGLAAGEADPGWWVLCLLARLGLVRDLQTPDGMPERSELRSLG